LLSGSLDGKCKVWSVERRECVATHSETEKAVWAVRWLPKGDADKGRVGERFAVAGGSGSIAIYREATGG
jgi:superkiller protein 8